MTRPNKPKRSKKPNATGRNNSDRFVRLSFRLLISKAYRSLSPNARALLVELEMLSNGSNNGYIYLSVDNAAARMGLADHHAAGQAFNDLQERGFIEMMEEAQHFHVKAAERSRARRWLLTWNPGPGRRAPLWTFLDWEPTAKTRDAKRMDRGLRALKRYQQDRSRNKFSVVDSPTLMAELGKLTSLAVAKSTTVNRESDANLPDPCMVEWHHDTAVTIGNGVRLSISDPDTVRK